ncbi:MAG: YdaU family protein [Acetobacter peroxydans]|nr:YdaU family protein [Acetobacter peroxydans]
MTDHPACKPPPDPARPSPACSLSAPAPLTPPDSDLRGLPFMPLDTVRLLDSDLFALSTGDEFKCAVALWCKAWQQVPAGSLPDHERVLAHLSGAGAGWPAMRAMALHGWVICTDGRLYHPVLAEKANHAWKARQAQRARANRRWHPQEPTDSTSVVAASDGAAAYARESTRESTADSTRESPQPDTADLRGARLSPAWQPDATLQAFASTLGLRPAGGGGALSGLLAGGARRAGA